MFSLIGLICDACQLLCEYEETMIKMSRAEGGCRDFSGSVFDVLGARTVVENDSGAFSLVRLNDEF